MIRENSDAVDMHDRALEVLEWLKGRDDEEYLAASIRVRMRRIMDVVTPDDLTFAQLAMVTAMVGAAYARKHAAENRLHPTFEAQYRPIDGTVGAVALRTQRLNAWLAANRTDHIIFAQTRYQMRWFMDQISPDDLSAAEVTTIAAVLGPVHGRLLLTTAGEGPAGRPALRLLTLDNEGSPA